jgi:hypothetical protein
MRVNVYAEELADDRPFEVVRTKTEEGEVFFGIRIYLDSSEKLHDTPEDDDRSAVTFWGPKMKIANMLRDAARKLERDNGE